MYYPSRLCVRFGVLPRLGVVALLAFILTGCGGGDSPAPTGPVPPPPPPPPPSNDVASVNVTPSRQSIYKIGASFQFQAEARNASGQPLSGKTFSWSSSHESIATVDANGLATMVGEGTAEIRATAEDVGGSADLTVAVVVHEDLDAFLATPASGHLEEIPVLIIRYLPTADGINLDVSKSPEFFTLGEVSLQGMRNRTDVFNRRVKFMLEERSRFRGYKDPSVPPFLGYRVVDHITVYEHEPAGKDIGPSAAGSPAFIPDHHAVFDRLNVEHYVNDLGVEEIWFWQTHFDDGFPSYDPAIHDPADFRALWESNMSSPTTGDISNSDRDNADLPVYDHTYIVYGYNIRRTQAEAVHNHGHQIEAMFSHVNFLQDGNTDLFWKKFVGQNAHGQSITGRAGWTHMPPNTTEHYDYLNASIVPSDIEDWTPDNSGQQTMVNLNTWGDQSYTWPTGLVDELNGNRETEIWQQVESQWYIYWMQNIPGYQNTIPRGLSTMSNWWEIYANWDEAIAQQIGLRGPPGYIQSNVAQARTQNNVRVFTDEEYYR